MEILALADDLTGALEIGAKFAARGIPALVTTAASLEAPPSARVLVIDTETRHVPPADAFARIAALARDARERGVGFLFKKTDSTLRGNIGSELEALQSAFPGNPVFYAPAYPQLGRTVRGGRLYVHGTPVEETSFARDPLNPIHNGDIPRVLAAQTAAPVIAEGDRATGAEPAIYVCDGQTDADIARVAALLLQSGSCKLAAGTAALAECLADQMASHPERPSWPAIRRCLVVNGSRHEVSQGQIRYGQAHGCVADSPDAAWSAVEMPEAAGESGLAYAARVANVVCARLREHPVDALAVFGGDTAFAILRALGSPALQPVGEVAPGVPLSRIPGRGLYLISKAGGFGPPDVLCCLARLLS